ncbi:uncharacterized protein LOC125946496 [Dermacentor silvarum]|uniref:uncharacterized protein LOC125946496 n=1 Tax=Dermacentor silvarum TaxID=543639 RepID=UPI002100C90B|nr:uncharacterized protein LOC125946496 [Dermacentor silvarum]
MDYGKGKTVVGLSFEMGTLMYALKSEASDVASSVYGQCLYFGMTTRSAVCGKATSPTLIKDPYFTYGSFVSDGTKSDVAYAEYHTSGRDKWQKARRALAKPRRRLAMLFYNVHLEDIKRTCSAEPFKVLTYTCEALKGAGNCN